MALVSHLNTGQCDSGLPDSGDILYPIPPAFYKRPGEDVQGRYHQSSGHIYGKGATLLDKLKSDPHKKRREHVVSYPFADEEEWELGKFLATNLTQMKINEFLKLKWVRF